jgi:hypothetical protein
MWTAYGQWSKQPSMAGMELMMASAMVDLPAQS